MSTTRFPPLALAATLTALSPLAAPQAHADTTVFADALDAHSTAGFSLPGYANLASLPTDSAGLSSAAQATWLVVNNATAKTGNETVGLQLSGLNAGQTYTVGLQLFVGGSWDGSAFYYGPDEMQVVVTHPDASTTTLLDAT